MISGDKSKIYEQVIFILRPEKALNTDKVDFVYEAEKIINNYVSKKYNQNISMSKSIPSKSKVINDKHKELDNILNICIVLCCVLLGVILYYFYA